MLELTIMQTQIVFRSKLSLELLDNIMYIDHDDNQSPKTMLQACWERKRTQKSGSGVRKQRLEMLHNRSSRNAPCWG